MNAELVSVISDIFVGVSAVLVAGVAFLAFKPGERN